MNSRRLNLTPDQRECITQHVRAIRAARFLPELDVERERQRIAFWQRQARADLDDLLTFRLGPSRGKRPPATGEAEPQPSDAEVMREYRESELRESNRQALRSADNVGL